MHRTYTVAVLAVVAGVSCGVLLAETKLTSAEVVRLHLRAVSEGAEIPADLTRVVRGVCTMTAPAKGAGQLPGTFRLASGSRNARFTAQFNSELYEGEDFAVEGDRVEIGFAQPRTSSRSAMGNFVVTHRVIVGEGLFGGVLNARWPLLPSAARQPKLDYDGLKKFAGRNLHRLRYRAKEKQGNLEIHLYFEPETYRHVASVYTTSWAQAMGATPESSSQQSDVHFRLEEGFSDFKQVGGLTLPSTWTVRYERSGNTASEWKYDLRVQSFDDAPTATIRGN